LAYSAAAAVAVAGASVVRSGAWATRRCGVATDTCHK